MIEVPKSLTGQALYRWLVENKQDLIDAKKATVKTADSTILAPFVLVEEGKAEKGKYLYEDGETSLKRTIVANTYNWLDSHGDVHLEGVFANSIAKRANRMPPHLVDHKFSMLAKVGRPISYSEREISWRELGIGKTGMTQALFLESEILKSYNELIFNEYKDGQVDQHSVSMRYVALSLAVNDEKNYPNEYKTWKEYISLIGNRSDAERKGWFWAVQEAVLLETSAVLAGSNELTPTLGSGKKKNDSSATRLKLDANKILSNYLN